MAFSWVFQKKNSCVAKFLGLLKENLQSREEAEEKQAKNPENHRFSGFQQENLHSREEAEEKQAKNPENR